MFLMISVAFVAMAERTDALLYNSKPEQKLNIEASGSLGLFYGDARCHPTFPNQTLISDRRYDWCSNLATPEKGNPWIQYSFHQKAMKLTGYAVRNGCCDYYCCCDPDTGKDLDFGCCCRLYSFSLLGSNDNKTWVHLHKVEKDHSILWCQLKNYEITTSESYRFIRFMMDEERPGCPKCIQVNQIELYGQLITSPFSYLSYEDEQENEESVSIIGKIKKY